MKYEKVCAVIAIMRGVPKTTRFEALVNGQYENIIGQLDECVLDAFALGSKQVIVEWHDGSQSRRTVYVRDDSSDMAIADTNRKITERLLGYKKQD